MPERVSKFQPRGLEPAILLLFSAPWKLFPCPETLVR
jgi:hypothetical protein